MLAQLPRTSAALAFAELKHAGQRRKFDGAPFIEHPVEVASLLCDAGAPDDVIAAGILHDTLEKTRTDMAELRARFGSRTAGLVAAVSEDESIPGYATRKAALRRQVEAAGTEAMMVFAADKVSKVRELAVEPPGSEAARLAATVSRTRQRRLIHYRRCLELLERNLANSPVVAQLRSELELRSAVPALRPVLAGAA
ncbi:MAG TPA: HD domain-containing protein [Solirubrobacteraceae bacterium]